MSKSNLQLLHRLVYRLASSFFQECGARARVDGSRVDGDVVRDRRTSKKAAEVSRAMRDVESLTKNVGRN